MHVSNLEKGRTAIETFNQSRETFLTDRLKELTSCREKKPNHIASKQIKVSDDLFFTIKLKIKTKLTENLSDFFSQCPIRCEVKLTAVMQFNEIYSRRMEAYDLSLATDKLKTVNEFSRAYTSFYDQEGKTMTTRKWISKRPPIKEVTKLIESFKSDTFLNYQIKEIGQENLLRDIPLSKEVSIELLEWIVFIPEMLENCSREVPIHAKIS